VKKNRRRVECSNGGHDGSMVHEYAAKEDGTRGEVTEGNGEWGKAQRGGKTKERAEPVRGLGRFSPGKRSPRTSLTSLTQPDLSRTPTSQGSLRH
jgi:hypothetical protein